MKRAFRCFECNKILRINRGYKLGLLQASGKYKPIRLCRECYRAAGFYVKEKPVAPLGTTVTDGVNTYKYVRNDGPKVKAGTLLDDAIMVSGLTTVTNQPEELQEHWIDKLQGELPIPGKGYSEGAKKTASVGRLIIPEGKDGQSET